MGVRCNPLGKLGTNDPFFLYGFLLGTEWKKNQHVFFYLCVTQSVILLNSLFAFRILHFFNITFPQTTSSSSTRFKYLHSRFLITCNSALSHQPFHNPPRRQTRLLTMLHSRFFDRVIGTLFFLSLPPRFLLFLNRNYFFNN